MSKPIQALIGTETQLPPSKEACALRLARGQTIQETAAAEEVGERTLKEWLKEGRVVQRIHAIRAEMTQAVLGRMIDASMYAVDTMRQLCRLGRTEKVRLDAARALLECTLRMREVVEFEQRIRALEQSAQGGTRESPEPDNPTDELGERAA